MIQYDEFQIVGLVTIPLPCEQIRDRAKVESGRTPKPETAWMCKRSRAKDRVAWSPVKVFDDSTGHQFLSIKNVPKKGPKDDDENGPEMDSWKCPRKRY